MTWSSPLVLAVGFIGVALATCVLVILAGRVARGVLDRRRAARERRLRPQLLALLAADEGTVPAELELRHGDLDVLADLAGPLLRKVRGDARDRLAAQLHTRGVVERARHQLSNANSVKRANAAAFLGNVGDQYAVHHLCTAVVHDRDPDVRATAARALGSIGRHEAASALLFALGGEQGADDSVSAGTVVNSLMALGPAAAPACLDAAVTAQGTRQAMAVETLGLLGHVPATDVLIGLLAIDPGARMEIRTRSARALGRIGSPRAVPFMAGILQADEPWPLRAVTARAIGDIGTAEANDALWAQMTDAEPAVVVNVARALATTADGRARLVPLAAAAPPPGVIEADAWEEHQPAVAAAEALATAGHPVEQMAGTTPTVEVRIDRSEPPAAPPVTVRSSAGAPEPEEAAGPA